MRQSKENNAICLHPHLPTKNTVSKKHNKYFICIFSGQTSYTSARLYKIGQLLDKATECVVMYSWLTKNKNITAENKIIFIKKFIP